MDIFEELSEISRLLESADFLNCVRESVAKVREEGVIVTDGGHHPNGETYDVVVRCGSDSEGIARRLQSDFPESRVASIADNVLGIKNSRRGKS